MDERTFDDAIAWLNGGDVACVSETLVNSLGTVSGMVCDGAKASCAAKIAPLVLKLKA